MTRGFGGEPGGAGPRWRTRGPAGCLLWIVVLALVVLLLSVLFGGFQRGTKAAPPAQPPAVSLISQPS